ncbi:MAG: hypothetical protein GY730_07205 [bacterium]|nr:hypothetical protein [bacterium]
MSEDDNRIFKSFKIDIAKMALTNTLDHQIKKHQDKIKKDLGSKQVNLGKEAQKQSQPKNKAK